MAQGGYYRGKNIWSMIKNWWENDVVNIVGAGAPTDGTSGTGVNLCGPGSQYTDISSQNCYINTGTKASPTWIIFTEKYIHVVSASIATTGNTDNYVVVPEAGSLASVDMSPLAALAASDTNFITWTITNLGQAGAGTAVMLSAVDANTTKATGGTALAANTKRSLTVTGVAADLVVAKGDRLLIRAAATGTLAGAVTVPVYQLRFRSV